MATRLLLDAGAQDLRVPLGPKGYPLESIDVKVPIAGWSSPLIAACRMRSYECVKLLLESGANPNGTLPNGESPSKICKELKDKECMRMFIESLKRGQELIGKQIVVKKNKCDPIINGLGGQEGWVHAFDPNDGLCTVTFARGGPEGKHFFKPAQMWLRSEAVAAQMSGRMAAAPQRDDSASPTGMSRGERMQKMGRDQVERAIDAVQGSRGARVTQTTQTNGNGSATPPSGKRSPKEIANGKRSPSPEVKANGLANGKRSPVAHPIYERSYDLPRPLSRSGGGLVGARARVQGERQGDGHTRAFRRRRSERDR